MAETNNLISFSMSPELVESLEKQLSELEQSLSFLVALTPDERLSKVKFGSGATGFVNQALELVKQDCSFMPQKFDLAEFTKDVTLLAQLNTVNTRMSRLQQRLKDTTLLAGSESYKTALEVYRHAKLNGSPELAPTIEKLAEFFQNA